MLAAGVCQPTIENLLDYKPGDDLWYNDGAGNRVMAVCEGETVDGSKHAIRLQDGTRLKVDGAHLQLLEQPDFSNIPKTPLEYRNEVGSGISLEEAHALATPQSLSPLQQELMSWHHCLYHLGALL